VESAGKRKPRRTTKGNVWLRWVLDEVAWAAGRFKETFFTTQFRRWAGCRNKRAIMPVPHSRLVVFDQLLRSKIEPMKKIARTLHEQRELIFQRVSCQRKEM